MKYEFKMNDIGIIYGGNFTKFIETNSLCLLKQALRLPGRPG
ncbi:hypothetical protein HMPREF0322_01473 [Desulfitobacterium hafniense DP7]|uniref:Uncharacterized protein n=1 Tax=Desulfitobacterium hafniense DP7 TaxID=537010 RepID=G9XKJ0_DESHA|nr:hypothetical protein HMPREF0322_01473 [Desulfitobacterium hafniense DP7]